MQLTPNKRFSKVPFCKSKFASFWHINLQYEVSVVEYSSYPGFTKYYDTVVSIFTGTTNLEGTTGTIYFNTEFPIFHKPNI